MGEVLVNPQCELLFLAQYHQVIGIPPAEEAAAYATIDAALDRDLSVCNAYLQQADVYWNNAFFGQMPPAGAQTLLRKAIQKIEKQEGESPIVLMSRGIESLVYRRDFRTAGDQLRMASAGSPGNPAARRWLAAWLISTGDFPAAIRQLDEAQRLDPYSLMTRLYRAAAEYYGGHYDRAIEECRRSVEEVKENWIPYFLMGCAEIQKGDFRSAEANLSRSRQLKGADRALAYLGYVYQKTGRAQEARRALAQMSLASRGRQSGVHDAIVLVALGEKAEAANRLRAAADEGDPLLLWGARDPILESLFVVDPGLELIRMGAGP
jgi:tetratricopeptide (TPR) repeat protein